MPTLLSKLLQSANKEVSTMPFLVTGTGRCGTGAVAKFLGIGHEKHWTANGPQGEGGDSSWMIPASVTVDVHLVRHPVPCIRSLAAQRGLFSGQLDPDGYWYPDGSTPLNRWGMYLKDNYGQVSPATFWVIRNNEIKARCRLRIEDLNIPVRNSRPTSVAYKFTETEEAVINAMAQQYGYGENACSYCPEK